MTQKGANELYGITDVHVITLTDAATTHTLTAAEQVNILRATALTGAGTVYLPPTAEAKGKFYSIWADGAPGADVTVLPNKGASYPDIAIAAASLPSWVLDADDEALLFYCDGLNWLLVTTGAAANAT